MKWTTKEGKTLNVKDMDDGHARRCIEMAIRNNSLQKVFALILEGRKSLLKKKAKAKAKQEFKLNGDMAQQFNDTYPGDEEDAMNMEFDPNWYKEGFG
jgi:hypothetical protein